MWWIMLWVQDRNTAVITQDWSSSWSCFCPAADGSELSKHSVTSNIHPYSRLDPHFKRRVSIHPDEIFTQSPEICDRMFFACLLCLLLLRSIIYRDQYPKGRHQKKNCRFGENCTMGGEGVRKIIEFSSFTNDEKHRRGGGSQSNISLLHRTQL